MPRIYRDAILQCADCGVEVTRRSPNQKVCRSCRVKRDRACQREWQVANRDQQGARRRAAYAADPQHRRDLVRARIRRNPEAHRAYHRRWRRANSARLRLTTQAKKFGTTPEGLLALLESQGNSCPVCAEPLAIEDFHVDHCHDTGQIRGLLHGVCNKGLGMLHDDPERCERAARYLRAQPPEVAARVERADR